MKKRFLFFLMILFIIFITFAHKPIFDGVYHGDFEHALMIKNAQVSQITYHEFSKEEPVFWIKFIGSKDGEIQIVLNIPYLERFSDLNVYMALFRQVSDDLDLSVEKIIQVDLPFEKPNDYEGVIFYSGSYQREFFHEPFSNTNSWFVLRQKFTPLETGVYYAAIWPDDAFSIGGKIGFSIGTLERFTIADLFKLPEWIEGIREFHEE